MHTSYLHNFYRQTNLGNIELNKAEHVSKRRLLGWFFYDNVRYDILWWNWRICCAALGLVAQSCLTLCNPMDCSPPGSSVHGDSPGKKYWVGWHALLEGIFPIQGLNPSLLLCCISRQVLYHWCHLESPQIAIWTSKLWYSHATEYCETIFKNELDLGTSLAV